MSEKTTPGPWRVKDGVCKHDHPETSADVVGPDGEFIADCGCADNAKSHARLISKAPLLPEMAEHLRELIKVLSEERIGHWRIHEARTLLARYEESK